MKKIKYIFILLLFFQANNFAQIEIEIKLDKNKYLVYEPIILLVKIKNTANEPKEIIFDLNSSRGIFKMQKENEKFQCQNSFGALINPIQLDANSFYYYTFPLLTKFGCTNSDVDKNSYLVHLEEGNYKISLEYHFSGKLKPRKVNSNVLNFTIVSSSSEKQLKQLSEYKELMVLSRKYKNNEFENEINKIICIDKFSPYALLAQNRLVSYFQTNSDIKKFETQMEKFCIKYPTSFVSVSYTFFPNIQKSVLQNINLKGKPVQLLAEKIKDMKNHYTIIKNEIY